MIIFLLLIPALAALTAIYIYRHTGKKDILKFDIVQFFYIFVLSPFLFVWLKTMMFFMIRHELGLQLGVGQALILDTFVSVLFLYVFAFIVIHGLTKTFSLKIKKDPLYDLFTHSEFFHLDISHLVIYVGTLIFMLVISCVNLLVPIDFDPPRYAMTAVLVSGFFASIIMFIGIWLYNSPDKQYMRIMKLSFGVGFLIHIFLYYLTDVVVSFAYAPFWFTMTYFSGLVILSLFAEKKEVSSRRRWLLDKLPFQINLQKSRYYVLFTQKVGKQLIKKIVR